MTISRTLPVLLLALLGSAQALAADEYKAQKQRYERYMERPSLYMRHRGRVNFAKTRDVRALSILMKSYARPEVPKDQVQYLLASICSDHFEAPPHAKAFRALRRKHAKPRDAWLWYRTLAVEHKNEGPLELIAALQSKRAGTLRAAALLALATTGDENTLPVLLRLLADLPAKPFDRALLLEAAAEVLWIERKQRSKQPWRDAAARLIPYMDDRATQERTKLAIARRLARVWHADKHPLTAEPWLARLEHRPSKTPPPPEDDRYGPRGGPVFLGLEGSGGRVVYVLDLSDSMLTPLTGKEIEDLKKTPAAGPLPRTPVVTGPSKKAANGDPKRDPGKQPPAKDDAVARLPWPLIKTRFDAARAFLKLSLRGLRPGQMFSVVTFGSEAAPLAATPGLRRATSDNVEKAIAELERIVAGPPRSGRPHGTLRGYTNMHGGLHRAFKVRTKGLVKEHEYVDERTFANGADTVFLLSDGEPTWDDWPMRDTLDPDNKPGDPETGAVTAGQKATFYGPYAIASWLLDDLRRLNLFRHVEVHCIGLGEYDPRLLEAIAYVGKGRFRRIGGD